MFKLSISVCLAVLLPSLFISTVGFSESEIQEEVIESYIGESVEEINEEDVGEKIEENIKSSEMKASKESATDSRFLAYAEADPALKLFKHHINYSYERINGLPASLHRLVTFVQLEFSGCKEENRFFSLAQFDEYHITLFYELVDHVDVKNKQQVDELFSVSVQSLATLISSYNLEFDYSINANKNILVYIGLLPKNGFASFLENISANTVLTKEDKTLLLYQYVISFVTLTMIYNEQMDKVHPYGKSPVLIDLKSYYLNPKRPVDTVSDAGKFIDKHIGRENFFLGLGVASTFGTVFATNKLVSKVSGKEFDAKTAAVQASVPAVIVAATYAINKLLFHRNKI